MADRHQPVNEPLTYRDAGVDIDAGARAVDLLAGAVRGTYTPRVLSDVGSFGGLFSIEGLTGRPVLVASTDGVGTKVKLAAELGRWRGVGHDLVNHCIDDILVQNARPLFFLDYVAAARLVPEAVAEIVTGMAEACAAAGCALLGGETAEMPGVYTPGSVDVAGTIVGLVDRDRIWPRTADLAAGDVLVALASSGPHTNGYSLIRRLVAGLDLAAPVGRGETRSWADALLEPHRSYLAAVDALGDAPKALAHLTGGGVVDNLPRVLPPHLAARVELAAWPVPPLFARLVELGRLTAAEAFRTFNMGVGLLVVMDPAHAPPGSTVVGELTLAAPGGPRVVLR